MTHPGPALFRCNRTLTSLVALALVAACSEVPTTPSSDPTPTTPAPPTNVLAGATFWVDPGSNARATATAWRTTRPADAAQMDKIATQGVAKWFGNWNANVQGDVGTAVTTMLAAGATPVLVAFNIPLLGCSGLSSNTTTPQQYRAWIAAFASGLAGRKAVVILEPDALGELECLSSVDQLTRLELLKFAVQTLTARGNVAVYIDAGHARWHSAQTMSQRLLNAGVLQAEGFSLNVANFLATPENVAFGTQLAALVGGKHFVIDTGRNGLGPAADGQVCNPPGRALGNRPSSSTGLPLVDAYLWIKSPGESDGACNGSPASGVWMPEYALGMAQKG